MWMSNAQFLIQTTAPIAHGSSGGPLFDSTGRVVGVTTSMRSDAPGIYFSVGIGDVRRLLRTPQGVAPSLEEWAKLQGSKPHSKTIDQSAPNRPGDEKASLEETVSWMTGFLEAHGQEWNGGTEPLQSNVMGLSQPYLDALRASSHSDLAGKEACVIFVKHMYVTPVQLHTDMKVPVKTSTEVMYFADIDPQSIKLSGSHVHLETNSNLDKILEFVPVDGKFAEYDLNLANFILDTMRTRAALQPR
jgi:hypothetical protein